MADKDPKQKGTNKTAENTLSLAGTLASMAGPLIWGPSFNVDLGAPFQAGANLIRQKREQQGLIDILQNNPATAPLVAHGQALAEAGGAVNNLDLISHPDISKVFPSVSAGQGNPLNEVNGVPVGGAGVPSTQPQGSGPIAGVGSPPSASVPSAMSGANVQMQAPSTGPLQMPPVPNARGPLLQAMQGQPKQDIDWSDPQTIARVMAVSPDMGKSLIASSVASQAKGDNKNNLGDILKVLQIDKAINGPQPETPDQKSARSQSNFDYQQAEKQKYANAKLTTDDQKTKDAINVGMGHLQSLPDQIDNRTFIAAQQAKIPGIGETMASFISPQYTLIKDGVLAAKVQSASAMKNSRVNPVLLDLLDAAFPDAAKNPQVWPAMKEQAAARYRLAGYTHDSRLADEGRTLNQLPIDKGGQPIMDPNTKKEFDAWYKMFSDNGQKALQSQTFRDLTSKLKLNGLMIGFDPNAKDPFKPSSQNKQTDAIPSKEYDRLLSWSPPK